jgi:hypothetical protein
MAYQVSRDGNMFGPYNEAELREYLASGNIVENDLVRSSDRDKWQPLRKVLKQLDEQEKKMAKALPPVMPGLRMDILSPPDMPWWFAMVLDILTGLTFFVAWDIVEGVWTYRVDRLSKALWYYLAAGVLFAIDAPAIYSSVLHNIVGSPAIVSEHTQWLGVASFVLRIVARFSMRNSLLKHFNVTEPIGLKLSKFWTLLFGGLYFQYHFNKINEGKRALEEAAVAVQRQAPAGQS